MEECINKVIQGDCLDKLKEFIEQELKKERDEIMEWIEKQDWECFEQTFIKKDIINTIKNRV